MSSTTNAEATASNTVTIMIGSYLNTAEMISSGVIPTLIANGDVGFEVLDGNMANATQGSVYDNNLVTQLASAWSGSGSGTQGMAKSAGMNSGTVELTNTTQSAISVSASGALFYAADGTSYATVEDPTNSSWSNGSSQTGSGSYIVAPGQTITVPIQATRLGSDAGSTAAGSIVKSSISGLTVTQPEALATGGSYSVSSVTVTNGGNYYVTGTVYTPTVTFSPSPGATAQGHVSGLYVAGEGWLGNAGTGYKVANNVPVEDENGKTLFTINIVSVGANGAITAISLNESGTLTASIPSSLSIVQAGASSATMSGTNFGVATVAIDHAGSDYTAPPTVSFSTAGSYPPASGTTNAVAFNESNLLTVSQVDVTNGGNYYVTGTAYTPTVSFSASSGVTATGHVSEFYVAGEGSLGSAGTGYKVGNNVAVEDQTGKVLFTINITSVGSNGSIQAIALNASSILTSSIPTSLSIVQSGGSGGTMSGTNFGVARVAIDNAGAGYTSAPTVTFSSANSYPAASGTSEAVNQDSWLTNNTGDYGNVFTNQGLAPAESYVSVNTGVSWSAADVTSWKDYVLQARAEGILNVAPLQNGVSTYEDPTQPFATSAFYAGIRQAALYGGGLEVQLPSYSVFNMTPTQWQTLIEEMRWCSDNGIRSTLLIENQGDAAGDPDANFESDTVTLLQQLQAEEALPSQVVLENNSPSNSGPYYDANTSDENSLNAAALYIANNFSLTPSVSEDGLEVKGTSGAQTTLIMTGVSPVEDVTSTEASGFAPYVNAQVFSEDPTKSVVLTVVDKSGLLSLSDSAGGAATAAGGTLTFTGTAAAATTFLNDLKAADSSGKTGVADLQLTVTDYLNHTTQGDTSVYLGAIHPTFTAVTETPDSSVGNVVQAGDTITFTVATSSPVTVSGIPELVLTNEEYATYCGQDTSGNLLFSYTVQPGDDTAALRVRGIDLEGSTITDSSTGLALNADSIDQPEAAMANPLVVNTSEDTITSVSEQSLSSGVLYTGADVTFLLGASQPIVLVNGTPTLELNDGGVANYAGLSASGQMEFVYTIPAGGAFANLAPTILDMNSASVVNSLGEAVVAPYTLPSPSSAVSYNATDSSGDIDTLVIALSADEYLGDATAQITVNGVQIASAINVSAIHSEGQTQLVTISGNFASHIQQLGISFTNDLWGGTATTDRNLYVDSVSLDGDSQLTSTELNQTSTMTTPIAPAMQDKLSLWVSGDMTDGDPMFSVAVDGNTLPGTFSTNVANSSGQTQEIDIYGNFGVSAHTVTITDLSGAYDSENNNGLYVAQAEIDGVTEAGSTQGLYSAGASTSIAIPAPTSDVLTLEVSEDAWQGDAQCYVTIDGRIMGGVTTVTAHHSSGAEQTITINAIGLSSGTHTVGLSFINDAWGGTSATDRNLYLDGAQLNGVKENVSAQLMTWGTASFEIGQGALPAVSVANITSLVTGVAAQTTIGANLAASTSKAAVGISDLHVSLGAPQPLASLTG